MPVIGSAEGPVFTATTVYLPTYAVMLYPRDEKRRRLWYAAAMAREYSVCREAGAPQKVLSDFHAWIPDLWELPLSPERVYKDGMARMPRACSSGYMLLHLLRLARYHPRHCQVDRAKALLVEFTCRAGDPISESLLEKSWAHFKGVSHLWASLTQHEKGERGPKEVLEWLDFLKRAAGYRRAAEAARLVSSAETWTTDMDLLFRSEADLDPLGPDKLEFLDLMFPA